MATPSTLVDNVAVYATSTGTGAIGLGAAVAGYRGIEALTNGQSYSYSIQQDSQWELGRAAYLSASKQLVRAPLYSSNGNAAISLYPNAIVSFVLLAEDLSTLAGLSAYQIWLQAGNTGTEEDFLASLKGDGSNYAPPSGQLAL
jgi:hypothetical protein